MALLRALRRHRVKFVVIGGIAAISQGSPLPTDDIDITPDREPRNLQRLAASLIELDARLRGPGEPDGVAFVVDSRTLGKGEIWTLTTVYGDLDISFTPAGTQGFPDLRRDATELDLGGSPSVRVLVASLADVIRSKEAANRPKDRAQLPALRQTLEATRERGRREAAPGTE